jgi:hypothetical protein
MFKFANPFNRLKGWLAMRAQGGPALVPVQGWEPGQVFRVQLPGGRF